MQPGTKRRSVSVSTSVRIIRGLKILFMVFSPLVLLIVATFDHVSDASDTVSIVGAHKGKVVEVASV